MKNILIILLIFIVTACAKRFNRNKSEKIYLSNTKVFYDMSVKSFKIDFSINNYTKETINNFVYQIIFKDDKGVVITMLKISIKVQ